MRREIKPYLFLLKGWKQEVETSEVSCIMKFQKNSFTIIFEEDLREHKINFTILHPLKRVIKIYFRECIFADRFSQIDDLISKLKQLGDSTNEKAELSAYFDFLKQNKFLP